MGGLMNPFPPREVLKMSPVAHGNKRNLQEDDSLLPGFEASWAAFAGPDRKRQRDKKIAQRTKMPFGKSEKRHCEVEIWSLIVPAPYPEVRWEPEMINP
jgi:hypothetical protein